MYWLLWGRKLFKSGQLLIRVFTPCPGVDVHTWVTARSPTAEEEHLGPWFIRLSFILVESLSQDTSDTCGAK